MTVINLISSLVGILQPSGPSGTSSGGTQGGVSGAGGTTTAGGGSGGAPTSGGTSSSGGGASGGTQSHGSGGATGTGGGASTGGSSGGTTPLGGAPSSGANGPGHDGAGSPGSSAPLVRPPADSPDPPASTPPHSGMPPGFANAPVALPDSARGGGRPEHAGRPSSAHPHAPASGSVALPKVGPPAPKDPPMRSAQPAQPVSQSPGPIRAKPGDAETNTVMSLLNQAGFAWQQAQAATEQGLLRAMDRQSEGAGSASRDIQGTAAPSPLLLSPLVAAPSRDPAPSDDGLGATADPATARPAAI